MKILIVDDNAADRQILKYIFEWHNYRDLIEARDGQEGLEMAEQHKPDLIVSDALMPRMDGFHFLKAMKAREDLKDIPFVFYSATYTGYNEVEFAKSLGAETFIIKPLEPEVFWSKLVDILNEIDAGKKGQHPALPVEEEQEYLREYSRIVAAKLEEKVHELEDAKEKISLSESFIRNILESVDEGFIVVNRDYSIVSANNAFARQVNMPIADIIGKHCYECSHHLEKPCAESGEDCAVKHTFDTGEPWEYVHKHQDGKGNTLYVNTKSFPMKIEAGNVTLAIEVCVDITEKKKLEDQLRHAQKMEAIGQLAGGIAHDFNNILTAIIGYGTIVRMKMGVDDPLRVSIDHILESADRAAKLTQSLLAFSRKQVANLKPVMLADIIQGVEKFLQRIIGEDIQLKTTMTPQEMIVNADTGQIEQVLMNFATNARDAMPQGGILTIETGTVEIDKLYRDVHGYGEPGMYAVISVSDTGIGMDEETKKKIFDPFFTTKETGKGTGLGLSIVYGIIQQHQGYVNVYSELGKGTTFRVYLPITELTAEKKMKLESTIPSAGAETVLLAEDDETVRTLSCSILKEFGYTPIAAENGDDAVKMFLANKDRIRLVILDVLMPKKNGYEAYNEIKELQPDMKILFVSGYTADSGNIQQLLAEGLEVMQKPLVPSEFLRRIRKILDSK